MHTVLMRLLILLSLAVVTAVGASAQGGRDRDRDYERGGDRGRERSYDDDRDRDRDEPKWVEITVERIGLKNERDGFTLDPRSGRFSAIRFEANNGAILVSEIALIFGNGEVERIRVDREFQDDEVSKPIDIGRRGRFVERIEFVARTSPRYFRSRPSLVFSGLPARAPAPPPPVAEWELLGDERVGFRTDDYIFDVGRREGRIDKLRIEAKENDIYIFDVIVEYGNGERRTFPVNDLIRTGRQSTALVVDTRDRFIKSVEVTARARVGFRERAVLELYGETLRSGGRPGPGSDDDDWEELGCQRVGFLADRDVIPVGRREGRFRALRFGVSRNSINVFDARVVYANGESDALAVRSRIAPGEFTRPIDLRGNRRGIEQIELVYGSKLSLRGPGKVCAYGLQ